MCDIKYSFRQAKFLAWLLFFMSFTTAKVLAQNYFFDNYGIRQGLGTQKVYALLQDSKHYIWLGTKDGVSRFDGKIFVNYSSADSISPGGVKCILEDSLGYIWFGHLNGAISRYDGRRFERVTFDPSDSIKISWDITSIAELKGKLWFTSASGGAISVDQPVANVKKMRGKQFLGNAGLSDQVFGSNINNNGDLICVVEGGALRKFIPGENRFEGYRMPHMTTFFETTCLHQDKKGDLWFGTFRGGLYKFLFSKSKMEFYDLKAKGFSSNSVSCLAEDSQGRVWVGTWGGGIALFNGDNITRLDTTNGLKASKIYDITEDVEGNILIADQDNGLTIFKGDAFMTLSDTKLLPDTKVNAILEDKTGSMWFGTGDGILRYNPSKPDERIIYDDRNGLQSHDVGFLREDKDGNIWIGSNNDQSGVMKFNLQESRFEGQPYIFSDFDYSLVKGIEIDRQNRLWIGTDGGLLMGKVEDRSYKHMSSTPDGETVSNIQVLYCDPEGVMWIGADNIGGKPGLIRVGSDSILTSVPSVSGNTPTSLVMDLRGVLWIGTDRGLYSLKNDSLRLAVSQNDGLLSNSIRFLATGSDGSIYIGSSKGLNLFYPDSRKIIAFTERNGFPGIEAQQNAVYVQGNGNMWFGTANGATRLTPSKLSIKKMEPLTHIQGIRVDLKPFEINKNRKLKYSQRSVSFDYYSICLTNPDLVRYKVWLEGAEDDWQPLTDQTWTNYSTRPPGKYKFMVIACNSNGVWNKEPVTFSFTIKPPFYRTSWFLLIVLTLIAVWIISYIKMREQNLKKEKKILEEKVEERTAEVVQKSIEIEEKNKDITASIRYAERIQQAMLPRENTFKETFVLFMPKDIVSGDFYWMYDNGDWQFIAAVDCTGHGVPGAFMSIIGHNALNKIVREYGLTRPAAIVDQLNIEVTKSLLQRHEKAVTDGMDIALIAFNRKDFTLEFSGAYSPLYLVRNGELFTYKGDRFPIGMTSKEEKKSFTNQIVDIKPGDMLYMCSDGYADQFGSTDGKKYKSGNVKKLLTEIWDLPICIQKDRLEKEILDWKGERGQVDDILFVGTKIPEN